MIPQFKEDLLHLERSRECLDQHRRTDGIVWNADVGLREQEDVIPEASLKVVLHFRKIEVWTVSTSNQFFRIMEEIQSEVEERGGYGFAVYRDTSFIQVPSTRAEKKIG